MEPKPKKKRNDQLINEIKSGFDFDVPTKKKKEAFENILQEDDRGDRSGFGGLKNKKNYWEQ